MAVRLPASWDGIVPVVPGVDFADWEAVGSVKGVTHICFEPSLGTGFTLVWELAKDSETGVNLVTEDAQLIHLGGGVFSLVNTVRPLGAYFRVHPSTDPFQIVEGAITSANGIAKTVWDYVLGGVAAGVRLANTASGGAGNYLTVTGWDFSVPANVSLGYSGALGGTSYLTIWATPSDGSAAYALASIVEGGDTIIHNAVITAGAHLSVEFSAIDGDIEAGDLSITVPRLYGASPIIVSIPYVMSGSHQTFSVTANGALFDDASGSIDIGAVGTGGGVPIGAIYYLWKEYEAGHEGEAGHEVAGVLVAVYNNALGTGTPETSGYTDADGEIGFYLAPDDYFVFRSKSGRFFVNPTEITVS